MKKRISRADERARAKPALKVRRSRSGVSSGPGNVPQASYSTPANAISEISTKKICTTPPWKNGTHDFPLTFADGGVDGVGWCLTRAGTISYGQYIVILG